MKLSKALIESLESYLKSPVYEKWKKANILVEKKRLIEAREEDQQNCLTLESGNMMLDRSCNTILVVDDSAITLKIAVCSLKTAGYQVQTAVNGEHALKLMKERHYDAVLIDMNMPVLDGFEAVRLFRQFEKQNERSLSVIRSEISSLSDEEIDEQINSIKCIKPNVKEKQMNSSLECIEVLGTDTETITELHTEQFQNESDTENSPKRHLDAIEENTWQRQLIIGMSTDTDPKTKNMAIISCQMDYFLIKPFTISKFLDTVRDVNKSKRR